MASLQKKGNSWYCQFYWQDRRFTFSLGRVTRPQAEARATKAGEIVSLLERGTLRIPNGVAIADFVKFDGQPPAPAESQKVTQKSTLGVLRDRYLAAHAGALEENTLYIARIHFKHLAATLGEGADPAGLTLADLQRHVDRRKPLVATVTIEKEIRTLRTAWNWAVRMGRLAGPYPDVGLIYAKTDEKPPFQTRAEIERQLPGLAEAAREELWESLYLTIPEIEGLLDLVRERSLHGWIYPMVCTAAHTGARRSELVRMRVSDVDFAGGVITIREKKRTKGRRSTRRVPLSAPLAAALKEWLAAHPGGVHLFCHAEVVARSKKRSVSTGYASGEGRPTSLAGREGAVKPRVRPGIEALTLDEATYHLKRTLADSQWSVVRGWHVCRHSFISACATKGVDQRLLQEWCGHMSAEMSRRYAHLYPSAQKAAMDSVFG